MNGFDAVKLVAGREISTRIRSKAFIASVIVSLLLAVAAVVIFRLASGETETDLGVVGSDPQAEALLEQLAEIDGRKLTIEVYDSEAEATAAIEAGDIEGVVVDGERLVVERANSSLLSFVSPAFQQANLLSELDAAGMTQNEIATALAGAQPLEMIELDPDEDRNKKLAIGFITVIALFMSIQIAGAYIGLGVLEEKSNRVVELILSSVQARHLLIGKLLGIGAIGLIQVTALLASAMFATTVLDDGALPAVGPSMAAVALLWFVLGYLFFGSLNAAGASLAARTEDAQAVLAPVSVLTMIGYGGSIYVTGTPDAPAARILSQLPMVSPFAMPGRFAAGEVTGWEFVLAAVICAATVVGAMMLAGHIYTRSVLQTDRTIGWREGFGRAEK